MGMRPESTPASLPLYNFGILRKRMFDIHSRAHLFESPYEAREIVQLRHSIDEHGVAVCMSTDGDETRLTAVLTGDPDPVRIPFLPVSESNVFGLRIPSDNTVAFFVDYKAANDEASGTIRSVVVRAGKVGDSPNIPIAAARKTDQEITEMAYGMSRNPKQPRRVEEDMADRLGLEGLGFSPEHTRGILRAHQPQGEFGIIIGSDVIYSVSTYVTSKEITGSMPHIYSLQSRFLIVVATQEDIDTRKKA